MDERVEEEVERPVLAVLGHGSTVASWQRPVSTDPACQRRGEPESRGTAPHRASDDSHR